LNLQRVRGGKLAPRVAYSFAGRQSATLAVSIFISKRWANTRAVAILIPKHSFGELQ
jgi:hypothetical protein